jgi:hypothetical protein
MDPLTLTRRALIGMIGTALAVALLAYRAPVEVLLNLIRRAFLGALVLGLVVAATPSSVRANELGRSVVPTSSHVVIHDAAETLRDWCRTDAGGTLRLVLPGGVSFELVSSALDPIITNHGDGTFHPFDATEVRAALAAVRYPIEGVAADVFILPFPRRNGLASAAGPGLILLSPGVYPLPREQQHAEFVHELGHVIQYAQLPDHDATTWDRYRDLRGIADPGVYWSGASHANRPHEIFAEDFRALFGGSLATSAGSVENPALTPPTQIPGLPGFLLDLSGDMTRVGLAASPNPARGPVAFSRAGTRAAALDVFDLAGRRIATLAPQPAPGGVRWVWDGRDETGRRPPAGVVFARPRDGSGVVRVTLLP